LDFISLSNFDGKNLKLFNLWNGFQITVWTDMLLSLVQK
jgi:hypothetical protein